MRPFTGSPAYVPTASCPRRFASARSCSPRRPLAPITRRSVTAGESPPEDESLGTLSNDYLGGLSYAGQMRILVTGGAGFIGSNFARVVIRDCDDMIVHVVRTSPNVFWLRSLWRRDRIRLVTPYYAAIVLH